MDFEAIVRGIWEGRNGDFSRKNVQRAHPPRLQANRQAGGRHHRRVRRAAVGQTPSFGIVGRVPQRDAGVLRAT